MNPQPLTDRKLLHELLTARAAFAVLYATGNPEAPLALWDSSDAAPGAVALRRPELMEIYNNAYPGDPIALAQQTIAENLASAA